MSESESSQPAPSKRGEFISFGILVIILLGTVIVIALLRPLIFNRIVPAVIGEPPPREMEAEAGQPTVVEPADEATPATDEAGTERDAMTDGAEDDAAATPDDSTETGAEAEVTEPVPPRTHLVQPGENLTEIAEQYGVTVQALIAANNIANPNNIPAGITLTIPPANN